MGCPAWGKRRGERVTGRVAGRTLLLCAVAGLALSCAAARASELRGVVTYHGLPVPGASVTLVESATTAGDKTSGDKTAGDKTTGEKSAGEKSSRAKKFVTVTDAQGFFSIADVTDGAATIDIAMTGFAPMQQSVTVAPDAALGKWELTLLSLEAIRATLKPVLSQPFTAVQVRSEPVKTAEAPKPEEKKKAQTDAASATASAEESTQTASDNSLLINGSVNNAATSQFSMAPHFGNTASGKSMYQYMVKLNMDTSALDAKTYSFTGTDTTKPNTSQLTGSLSMNGPIKIPNLLVHGPNLYMGYQRVENSSAVTTNGIMPTLAQRQGDLSSLSQKIYVPATGLSAACLSSPEITTDITGTYFKNNQIPADCINTVAEQTVPDAISNPNPNGLLNHYPYPNVSSNAQGNYQVPVVSDTHSDGFSANVDKSIGPKSKDHITGYFGIQSTRSSNGSLFGFVDSSHGLGMSSNVRWAHTFNWHLHLNVSYDFSHQSNRSTPYWQNHADSALQNEITGNDTDPTYWGPPSLNFSSGISGLTDGNSSLTRNETNAVSTELHWNHGQHNVQFGFGFRRQEYNYHSQANPRGSFSFTGTATSTTVAGVTSGGSDLADFLLGIPDASAISYGNPDKYLRQSVFNGFAQDDWRMNPQLTMKVGLRWDYGAPVTELQNRLLNLDVTQGFTAQGTVKADTLVGTTTQQSYPKSLVRPDRIGFQPNIGVSWRPIPGSSLVIGAGYQMSYDTSAYQSMALQMANQYGLQSSTSKVLSLTNGTGCALTLANGFSTMVNGVNPCPPTSNSSSGTFGVDPNFRIGYVDTWNLRVQRDLPGSLQMTAIYLGNKGTRGAQLFLPQTTGPGAAASSFTSGYKYLASGGNSHRESGQIQLRRRLHNGFTASALYTFSKSIDDDSSFGGQGAATSGSVAQNWNDLGGERGLSTFDQRHLLSTSVQYTTGMGMGGGSLLAGWRGRLYKEWTVLTQIKVGSGLPETPRYAGVTVAGYGNVVRPSVSAPTAPAQPGAYANVNAFTLPTATTEFWGDARRDSITGPNQFSMDASMARTIRMKGKYTVDLKIAATNLLNHATYTKLYTNWLAPTTDTNGTITPGNKQFGLPSSANAMRDINASLSFRF